MSEQEIKYVGGRGIAEWTTEEKIVTGLESVNILRGNVFDMPEDNAEQIINKIYELTSSIGDDWSDPRSECRNIWTLCEKLKIMIVPQKT